MADDKPYAPVVEALVKQTRAINQLARELKEEFSQYQAAVKSRDNKRASAIADAINQRTARLVAATEQLESSTPDAGVGGGPADPSGRPDQGLPGVDRPTDPGYGQNVPNRPSQGLPGEQPGAGQDLPGSPNRPSQGLPGAPEAGQDLPGGRPNRPSQGLPGEQPGAGQDLPGSPNRPSQGVPGAPEAGQDLPGRDRPTDPGFGQGRPPGNRPSQGLPGEQPGAGQDLPGAPARPGQGLPGGPPPTAGQPLPGTPGTKPVDPNAPEAGQELPEGSTPPPTAGQPLPPSGETKPVEPTDPNAAPKEGDTA